MMKKQLSRVDLPNGNRICNKCKIEKSLNDFLKSQRCSKGRTRTCKQCTYEKRALRIDKDKEKEYKKNWYLENKEWWMDLDQKILDSTPWK